ncbi:MAG: DUF1858 domain-containing protein [Sphaerochaetaceae bacterium]|jgi:hypothetical protein|nr:DUF1858 domain-containing protein [Sphaerochaetaceae bacterium]MDD3366520.1 DUF1858 domain-containing protein [Sphaerochaetaceae bacterium]MDD4219007.1 DUF1858 domain-containing protein [Sphaerochaetaceae bacterium]MDY0371894.1 DUF1858 domain-containing protein [Sphaerochaetaceae bacterium]
MATKRIDLEKSVYALCTQDPDLVPILAELGFTEILKPIMLKTVGKVMTLPKGATMRNIELATVVEKLKEYGYTIEEEKEHEC